MKKPLLLAFSFCCCCLVWAATVTVEEDTPFRLAYDATDAYPTKIYKNGAFFRLFSTNELSLVSVNATNNTYSLSMPGFGRGNYSFTATLIYDGTNETDFSNAALLQTRPRKPGNLRRFQ